MNSTQPKKIINRFSLRIALINLFIGIELFFMPFLLLPFKDSLPESSVLRMSGGGDMIFLIFPISVLITLVGLIMAIRALVIKQVPVPKGAPLTNTNKASLVFMAIFALTNLRITLIVVGLG
jgi:hypothetical protein